MLVIRNKENKKIVFNLSDQTKNAAEWKQLNDTREGDTFTVYWPDAEGVEIKFTSPHLYEVVEV